MTARQFFDNVVQLRIHQKAYFKTRDRDVLQRAKDYEKVIDDEIDRVNGILNKKSALPPNNLFDNDFR